MGLELYVEHEHKLPVVTCITVLTELMRMLSVLLCSLISVLKSLARLDHCTEKFGELDQWVTVVEKKMFCLHSLHLRQRSYIKERPLKAARHCKLLLLTTTRVPVNRLPTFNTFQSKSKESPLSHERGLRL